MSIQNDNQMDNLHENENTVNVNDVNENKLEYASDDDFFDYHHQLNSYSNNNRHPKNNQQSNNNQQLNQNTEIGKCCFCNDDCNPHSQACGPCLRKLT